ncbi:MAG: YbaK/EbsC family protein [Candidatus Bathyarchaeia archaeon]
MNYSKTLTSFVTSKNLWHRLIEFDEPVRTVEQASRQVDAEKIVKSIVMVDSNDNPILALVPAKSMVSHEKLKKFLDVRDVRLASHDEVLRFTGYPAGGVPPFNNIKRVIADPQILKNERIVVGGGDVDKLLELRTKDVIEVSNAQMIDIIQSVNEQAHVKP